MLRRNPSASLLIGPKTFEEIESLISSKIASRILKRLRSVGLIETPEERDYIFFFKSKRDPGKETFTETERKIYDTLPNEGISAGKLAKETGLSMRRTYKYLRGLKGKKLVFIRKTPKAYGLTCKGEMLASVLTGASANSRRRHGVFRSKSSTATITLRKLKFFLFIRRQEPHGTERFPRASSTNQPLLWFRHERLFLKPSLASRGADLIIQNCFQKKHNFFVLNFRYHFLKFLY